MRLALLFAFMAFGLQFASATANAANYRCAAYDKGWEEHWGGHSSCGACLAKHGKCTERCTESETRCQVEGERYGYRESFYGSGDSRWDAEREAMRDCQWRGAQGCTVKSCEDSERIVSENKCR